MKLIAAAMVALALPAQLAAQQKQQVVPDARYGLSPLGEAILGSNWRDLWLTPVNATVLDLGTYAGGLTPFRAGGNQSRTLRMHGADGKTYIFRSTGKFVQRALPSDLRHTPVGYLIQDQTSSMHPTGQLPTAHLQKELGLLVTVPTLVVMPDDPRLGKFRKDYAGLLGQIEVRPGDAKPTDEMFGGKKVQDSDKLLENLEESFEYSFASREYLKARLVDFLVGDTDRGADQWQWTRIEDGDTKLYRPIPRDRDYAFMYANGLAPSIIRTFFPKLAKYQPQFPGVKALVFMTQEFDRSHLVDLSWTDWQQVVGEVQNTITDRVIEEAIAKLPPEHQAGSRDRLVAGLRARRAALPDIAREYYTLVSREADVFATNADDVAEITRHADGTVEVLLFTKKQALAGTNGDRKAAFRRTFLPSETVEIRVYLQQGADRALVRGQADHSIKVRVIGGAGDDVLADSSSVAENGHATVFYDAHGNNTIVAAPTTRVSTKPYFTPQPKLEYDPDAEREQKQEKLEVYEERRGRFQDLLNNEGNDVLSQKTSSAVHQHWGGHAGWGPAVDYREGAGLMIGINRNITEFGFRHDPYESHMRLNAFYGVSRGGVGIEGFGDFRHENSGLGLQVFVRASQLESNRFYGFGNDSELVDQRLALVPRDELMLRPALRWDTKRSWFGLGPIARYTKAAPVADSPAELDSPAGLGKFAQAGAFIEGGVRRTHWRWQAGATAFPTLFDVTDAYVRAHSEVAAYLPLGAPTLALRAGGTRVLGEAPLHDAAFIGGRHTLRGYRWNRFSGDAEVHATAELRVPVARVTLLTRGQLGLIGFTDAGRVWHDGASPGSWHTSVGGGLSFLTMGRAVSAFYARGEESRFYLSLGMPF